MSCNRQAQTSERSGVRAILPVLAVMLAAAAGAGVRAETVGGGAVQGSQFAIESETIWDCVQKRLKGLPCEGDNEVAI